MHYGRKFQAGISQTRKVVSVTMDFHTWVHPWCMPLLSIGQICQTMVR